MSLSKLFVLASAAALITSAASAATSLQYVAADFANPVGNTQFVTYANTDGHAGNEKISWGEAISGNTKSSLAFATVPAIVVTPGTQFTLGTLTYANFPIGAGTGITSVNLSLSALLNVDGTPLNTGPFTFSIAIDETPNEGPIQQCPYYSNLACSDKISITTGAASQTFQIGGQALTLSIDGFLDARAQPQSSFIAQEIETTTATLVGRFTVASNVPEPAAWTMLIVGFGLTGAAIRRERRVALA